MSLLFGIDLGGTKIELVILDQENHHTSLFRERIPTKQERGYRAILESIQELILKGESAVGYKAQSIGIGTPGTLDSRNGLLRGSNTQCLNDKPIQNDLEELIKKKVVIDNDANCFSLAEATIGRAQGYLSVFGIIMGTGVGGGIVINQKVLHGKQGIAGEWGHNVVDTEISASYIPGTTEILVEHQGTPCYCGKRGCVEATISGPALEAYYEKSLASKNKTPISLSEIYEPYKKHDEKAERTINRLIHFFGKSIATVVNILDPHIIVLGGGVSNIEELYTHGAEEAKKYIFNPEPEIKIVQNILGDSAGVFGAAMLTS
ncbi:MAG TPA: ROK family protein [Oligoflexia bacterium]|nr:ROK family protein [Oligoflexia bacterium]HMP48763.1 ROK family protein [Oligoflexia bacterium]